MEQLEFFSSLCYYKYQNKEADIILLRLLFYKCIFSVHSVHMYCLR